MILLVEELEAGFKNYIKVNKILKYKKITNQIIR